MTAKRAAALVFVAATAVTSNAAAVHEFAAAIQAKYNLSYNVPCRLCHIQGTTGAGSVQTPFGISMLAHGLTQDRSTLNPALDALDAQNVDSDGDGVTDINEIKEDSDPNTPLSASLSSGAPTYGCATAGGVCRRGWPVVAAAMGLLLAFRRRRARRAIRGRERRGSASASTGSRASRP